MGNFIQSVFGRFFSGGKKANTLLADKQKAAQEATLQSVTETTVLLTIWTIERTRNAVARALCTNIELNQYDMIDLYEGIMGYVVATPNGESVVIDARTGSLIGHSLEIVRDGVREMTKLQLFNQLDTARKEFNRMKKIELPNDEFWQAIRMGDSDIEIAQEYQE
ncbi:MAG: hypothetical protein ACOH1I_09810 [Gallionellaceae bacterium]